MATTALGVFSATYGKAVDATRTASWMSSVLVCSLACTIASPFCSGGAAGTFHANVIMWGTGLVAGTCFMQPSTTASLYCRSDIFTLYTATCTANSVNTVAGAVTWSPGTPNCGTTDGAMTGYYINDQAANVVSQTAGQINGFTAVTSTLAKVLTNTLGQWGGYPRATTAFQTASTYIVIVIGCVTGTTNGECVQNTINWWRCAGLTIDCCTVCYAASVRVACPTHTNGFRCADDSKKGLLGLLGLLGLIPLLLCISLICCLLLCLCRRKKTEGDVHFATFDPHAAPIGPGSVAPGTACYAPSMGGPVVY
jgi:hypothetical protein